jgi:RNA polymerase sigma-70 factor (ECF subfamily)
VNERQTIRNALTGDPDAERKLYNAHVDRVYRLAYRMTGDGALAEDLTQDTFIRAFDKLTTFRGDGPFGGWLHRIATSVIYSALRKRQRIRHFETTEVDPALLETAGGPDPRDRDLRRRLDAAIGNLEVNHRLVFVMHDLEGFTHPEIAAAMDTPVGTAKARLSRAREKLRRMLSGADHQVEDMETGS